MLREIIFALWFFLPAGVANAMPILVAHVPALKKYDSPIDCGLTFRGRRILGSHKTWRGLISGLIASTLVLWLQQALVIHSGWAQSLTREVDYASLPTFVLGPLFGLGALAGDAVESFVKRQRGVPPGHGWFPFDQTDYIIGGAIASAPFVQLKFDQYAWLLLLWLMVHVIASYAAFALKLKKRPI